MKIILMKQIAFFLFLFVSIFAYAENDVRLVYKVTNFSINDENYDSLAIANNVALVLYTCNNGAQCFANTWRKAGSQSYGGVYEFEAHKSYNVNDEMNGVVFYFRWEYWNTYDNESGEAFVTIKHDFDKKPATFIAEIVVTSRDEVLVLKGFME